MAKSVKRNVTATKKNPEAETLPGFYRLLPQLVGSFDPGGVRGVGGRGMPSGSEPINSIKSMSQPHWI